MIPGAVVLPRSRFVYVPAQAANFPLGFLS